MFNKKKQNYYNTFLQLDKQLNNLNPWRLFLEQKVFTFPIITIYVFTYVCILDVLEESTWSSVFQKLDARSDTRTKDIVAVKVHADRYTHSECVSL